MLTDTLIRAGIPLNDPKFRFDLRNDLIGLSKQKLLMRQAEYGDIYYTAYLLSGQMFELAELPVFTALLDVLKRNLRDVFSGEAAILSDNQKIQMSHYLCGCMLAGRTAEYEQAIHALRNKPSASAVRLEACRYAFGRISYFPDALNEIFFDEVFAFQIWNTVLIGSSIDKLLEKFFRRYPDSIPDEHLENLLCAAAWCGKTDLLRDVAEGRIHTSSPYVAQSSLSFVSGQWEQAYQGLDDRRMKILCEKSVKDAPLLLLLNGLLAGIRAGTSLRLLNVYFENLQGNAALRCLPGVAEFLVPLLRNLAMSMRTGGEYAETMSCEPERKVPVFCNMLKSVFLVRSRENALPAEASARYFESAEKLEAKGQYLTAMWLYHSLAALSGESSLESEYASEYAKQHPELCAFIGSGKSSARWEQALAAIGNAWNGTDTEASVKTGTASDLVCSWNLVTRRSGSGMVLDSIQLRRHVRAGNGSLSKGRIIPVRDFAAGEVNDILSPEEMQIRRYVKYGSVQENILPSAVEKLIDNPRVYLDDSEFPVTVAKGRNTIISTELPDGGISVSFRFRWAGVNTDAVYLYHHEDGTLRYLMPDSESRKLDSIFDAYGENGILPIPKDGRDQLLSALAPSIRRFTVDGALQKPLYKDMPSVDGKICFFARLRDTLSGKIVMELKNRPVPAEKKLFQVPGRGSAYLAADIGNERKVVIRNLEEERTAYLDFIRSCPALHGHETAPGFWELPDKSVLLSVLADLQDSGIETEWCAVPEIRLLLPQDPENPIRLEASGDSSGWFTLGGEVPLDDDRVMALTELIENMDDEHPGFVHAGNERYIRLTGDFLKQLELLRAAGHVSEGLLTVSPAAMPMFAEVFDTENMPPAFREGIGRIRDAFRNAPGVPDGFRGELRPYQLDGYRYLARMAKAHIGCCLADDMGLGKTVQLLALMLAEKENGAALVVAPASVCRNWEAEAHKFAPELRVTVLRSPDEREEIIRNAGAGDLIITSYGLLLTSEELFISRRWHTVILDEAQSIKNHTAKRTKAARNLQADIRIAATGTPIENRLQELWSIFSFLEPGLLGSEKTFENRYCHADSAPESLRRLVAPLILRRLKSDVLQDLPEKTEAILEVELSADERALYETLRRKAIMDLKGNAGNRISILAHLTKLRRVCCHPSLAKTGLDIEGSKLMQLADIAGELRDSGHRVLIFSQFVDFLTLVKEEFEKRQFTFQYLDGSTPADERMKRVNGFQAGNGDFFLISLKAGGTGLNLTGADYVILADPWWNPAVEDQAADRAHRIGQKNPVTVYRMVTTGTVEEKVIALHEKKRNLAEKILSDSGNANITAEELLSLLE